MQFLQKSLNISHLNTIPAWGLGTCCSLPSASPPLPFCRSPPLDLSGSKPGISLKSPQNHCSRVPSAGRHAAAPDQVLCGAANPHLQEMHREWTSNMNAEGSFNAKVIHLVLFLLFHLAPPFLCSEIIK